MTKHTSQGHVLHICEADDWRSAERKEIYTAKSIATDGFIHLSLLSQVIRVADSLYAGEEGLVLLVVDTAALASPIVYEDCYDSGTKYPNLYGSLNIDAVVAVVEFPPGPDGNFSLPKLPSPPNTP